MVYLSVVSKHDNIDNISFTIWFDLLFMKIKYVTYTALLF
jgi:hypothetical protein